MTRTSMSLFFVLLLVASPMAARETSPDRQTLDNAALRERVAALEARLAALESGTGSIAVSASEAALLDRLAAVEGRMARLEQVLAQQPFANQVASLGAVSTVTAATAPQSAALAVASSTVVGADETAESEEAPLSIHTTELFLPSRGEAGGALHYGGAVKRRIDLHAFLDLEYIDTENDGSRNGVSTFDNHHANIFIRAQLRKNLLGHIEVEYEHSGDVVEIDQAFVSWTVKDGFTLDAGRFYTPFGIERFVNYSPTNALVSRPLPLREIVPGNFYANGIRASGLVTVGEKDRFSYEVAVSDGLGDDALNSRRGSRQTRDNNSSRALSGRIGYAFWPRFEVGTSFHTQRYADTADLDLTFFGLDFAARFAGFELRAEYIDAEIERAGTILGDLEQDGWYAQLAYAFQWDRDFLPQLKVVGRFDTLDLDGATTGNDDLDAFAIGLNALLYNHFRLKAEYQFVDEDGPTLENDAFRLQFVLDY